MKKYITSGIIILILMSLLMQSATAADNNADGYIYLKADKSKVTVNEEFLIEVYIETDKKVGALQFSVIYDPNIVEIKGVELAESNKHVMMQSNLERGEINCGIITLNGISPGKLLIIRAVGVKRGAAEFKIKLQEVADVNVNALNFKVGDPITVSISQPIRTSTSPARTSSIHKTATTSHTSTSTATTSLHKPSSTTSIQTSTPSHTKEQTKNSMPPTSSPISSTKVMSTKTGSAEAQPPASTSTTQKQTSPPPTKIQTSTVSPTGTPEKAAKIFIASSPSGAEVYINNRYLGTTPMMIEVSPGRYTIKVTYRNLTREKELIVSSGQEYSLNFVLVKQKNTATSSNTKNICGPGSVIGIFVLFALLKKYKKKS